MDLSESKLELIELVLSSTDSNLIKEAKTLFAASPTLNPNCYEEIDRRRKSYQQNKAKAVPWNEVKQRLLNQEK